MNNEIIITVKPSSHRDMVKHALQQAGFKITGSGYMLPTDTGDLVAIPPSGAHPEEFGPEPVPVNLPPGFPPAWWPLFPKWASPLRSLHGHSKPAQADFLAREPARKVGILFGRN